MVTNRTKSPLHLMLRSAVSSFR